MLEQFSKEIRLTYADCDWRAEQRVSAVMRQIQEIAGEHLAALSIPRRLLWEQGFVFLLTRVQLRIERMPCAEETVRVITQPYEPKGALYFRDVNFETTDGERLLTAQTAWVLADPQEHRIRRPSEFPHKIPMTQAEYEYGWAREKIRTPENAFGETVRLVRYSDIDVNGHMNNAVYSDIVADCLPSEVHHNWRLRQYTISFIGEARLDDELHLCTVQTMRGTWYVGAQKADGARCFESQSHWEPRV